MKLAYIIGVGVIAIGGAAVYFINEWLKSNNINEWLKSNKVISHTEEEDVFDKDTIKKWMNSLDLPEIDSSYRFFAIKVDRNNLNELHISQKDKLKLQNAGSNKVLIALVVSDSNLDTKESIVYVCNSISSELGIENEVTELHLK